MAWYEHLLGILAILTCFGWLLVIAAIYVGAESDRPPTQPTKCHDHSTTTRDHSPFARLCSHHLIAAEGATPILDDSS